MGERRICCTCRHSPMNSGKGGPYIGSPCTGCSSPPSGNKWEPIPAATYSTDDLRGLADCDARSDEPLGKALRWAADRLDTLDEDGVVTAFMDAHNRAERFSAVLSAIRAKLHAANRPTMTNGLRMELRDMIDAAFGLSPHKQASDQ